MDSRLDQELVIDLKTEVKRPVARSKPVLRREPDWENRSGVPIKGGLPGNAEELQAEAIAILKRCIARLEGTEPQRAWEPRSQSWPYTSMGLALMKVINLVDAIADRLLKEAKTGD